MLEHWNAAGFAEASTDDKLVVVDFWADWCGPCKMLGPTVETLAERYDGKARVGKINVDQDPELARHFGVMSIPTVVFLKGGREIARKVGVMPEAVYDGLIQENLYTGRAGRRSRPSFFPPSGKKAPSSRTHPPQPPLASPSGRGG